MARSILSLFGGVNSNESKNLGVFLESRRLTDRTSLSKGCRVTSGSANLSNFLLNDSLINR